MEKIAIVYGLKERYIFDASLENKYLFNISMRYNFNFDREVPAKDNKMFSDREREGIKGANELNFGKAQYFFNSIQNKEVDWETPVITTFYINDENESPDYTDMDRLPSEDWYFKFYNGTELSLDYCLSVALSSSNISRFGEPLKAPKI